MTTMGHQFPDSPDFREGVAYAAHMMLHTVNAAHGHTGHIPASSGLKPCCRQEVILFAQGITDALKDLAGEMAEHEHSADPGTRG